MIKTKGGKILDRKEALGLVGDKIKNKNLIKHCLAVEAIMKEAAAQLNKRAAGENFDEEKWAMAGLVHDIDYESTANDPEKHSLIGADMLKDKGFGEDIVYAVRAHNGMHGLPLKSKMDTALYAADPLSGLIVAAALIRPEKKIRALNTQSVLKRFKEKAFARGVSREQIKKCEALGLTLEEFIDISLSAMQKVDKELGL